MTTRLYYDHPYLTQFTARIVSQEETKDGWNVILDQTAFYPEGGGQASDKGTLNGQPILKLSKSEQGVVIHTIKNKIQTADVKGTIDWATRFAHMQQHSGQHVLSAAIFLLFGLQTIQAKFDAHEGWITLGRALSEEEIKQVLQKANSIVFANLPITTTFISVDQMQNYPLVKMPKDKFSKEGKIRIWHIDNYYTIPCGGTHVKRTGEIGTIFISKQTKEGGLAKVFFTTGSLTLSYLTLVQATENALEKILEATQKDITRVAEKLSLQAKQNEKKLEELTKKLAQEQAKSLPSQPCGMYTLYELSYSQEEQASLKQLLFALTRHEKTIAIASAATLPLAIACSDDTSPHMLVILKELLQKYQGKGGGTLTYWQAMHSQKEGFIQELLRSVASME